MPLFLYRLRALDTMWAHLTAGAPLPESQVVRTSPRGGEPGSAPALEASNVPPVPTQAAIPDRILVRAGRVDVPIDAQFTGANVCFAKVRLAQQPVLFQPDLADEREAKRFRFMPADEGGANIQTSNPLQPLSARSHYRAALDRMRTVEGIG